MSIAQIILAVLFAIAVVANRKGLSAMIFAVHKSTFSGERFAITARDVMPSVVSLTPGALEDTESEIGEYLERILLLECLPEVRASLKADKGRGIGLASQAVMKPIIQSLQIHVQNSEIGERMFSKIEKERIEKLLDAK